MRRKGEKARAHALGIFLAHVELAVVAERKIPCMSIVTNGRIDTPYPEGSKG